VFAINARTKKVQAIRSYRVHSDPNPPFTILQAARATMASPDLFSSVYVGSMPNDKEYVAYFMNPIKSVLEEAGKIFDDTTKVACILSLGSGTKQVEGLPDDPQPNDRIKMLVDVAEDCETAHQEAASRYGESRIYHRINAERDPLYKGDEWDDGFTRISRATSNHLQANVKSLDRVVDRFIRRVGGPMIRDLSSFIQLNVTSTLLILLQIVCLLSRRCSHLHQLLVIISLAEPISWILFWHTTSHHHPHPIVDIERRFCTVLAALERPNWLSRLRMSFNPGKSI
jgi:hypothetical protein